jgi:hypothetical protein
MFRTPLRLKVLRAAFSPGGTQQAVRHGASKLDELKNSVAGWLEAYIWIPGNILNP